MFGLVADDELYLKTDKHNREQFTELCLEPFEYTKEGKTMKMSYYRAPEEIFEDPERAAHWANSGFAAALRAANKKTRKG
jgi:DNA transformation protein